MEELERIQEGNYIGVLRYGDAPESPREWSNTGTLITRGKHVYLGDKHDIDFDDCTCWEDDEALIKKHFGRDCIMLPVYAYIHSGMTISTTPFSCPWDSGRLGTIVVSRSVVRETHNKKRISRKLYDTVVSGLVNEIEILDQYVRGDVYTYEIYKQTGDTEENVVSLCGVFGIDDAREMLQDDLNHLMLM